METKDLPLNMPCSDPEGCKHFKNEIKLEERVEELSDALRKINNWAKAYPLTVFPEPDFKIAAKVLKAAGLSLDAISASNMRHVINGVKDITEQALLCKEIKENRENG